MKVLFLNHNQENVGTYYRCYFLAKFLAERGTKVVMLCASGKSFDLLIRKKKISENFTIYTLPRIKYSKYFTGQILFRLPLAFLWTLFSSYDICHAFTVAQPQIGIPAWAAKKIRRKKLVVDWDDLWGGGFADYHAWPIKRVLAWFENDIPHFADHLTYVSEFLGEKIKDLGLTSRATKVPNGSDPQNIVPSDKVEARQELNLDLHKKYLVAMGNTYLESFEIMTRAMEKVVAKDSTVNLILLGQVDIPVKLKSSFDVIKNNIIIGGFVPIKRAAVFMSAADILLLPMDSNPIEKARFPIRLGDYLCAGRPIISNAVGEVKYYLGKYSCGLVSPPNDTDKMAENILSLLDNEPERRRLGEEARKVAENILPWKKIVVDLEQIYQRLMAAEDPGIIILSPFYEPNTGGVETHLRDLSKYLLKQGRRVCVLTYQPLTTEAKAPLVERKENLVIHRVPWIGHNLFHKLEEHPVFQFLYLTPILFFYTLFFLLKNRKKYKIIHAHGLTAALIANVMHKIYGIKFVVSMHAIYGFRPGWWLSRVCRLILAPAKKIFCLAEASRQDIRQLGLAENQLDLYIQWVDQDNFKPRDKNACRQQLNLPEKFTVLFVGRMIEKKGVLVLLEAARLVGDKANFIFIGDGPVFLKARKMQDELSNVLVVGKKDQEEVSWYFGAADVVVVPSQYEEGFARVVLETISSGRPIIAANSGCLPEMITPQVGVLLTPTAKNIARQIDFFIEYPEKLRELQKNCRDYALAHFGETHAKKIEESYFL